AERMRAGGCGIPAFYTPTGYGTPIAEGKPTAEFDGRTYVLERAISADVALVHAHTADTYGNLRYRLAARNFNPMAAMCGQITFAEAEHIAEPGGIDPDDVHTPGVYVHHLLQATAEKDIEQRTVRPRPEPQEVAGVAWARGGEAGVARGGPRGRHLRDPRHGLAAPGAHHPPQGVALHPPAR